MDRPDAVGHGEGSAANDGVPKHAKKPAAKIHAAALLTLIVIWESPRWPVPAGNETSSRVRNGAEKRNLLARADRHDPSVACRSSRTPRRRAQKFFWNQMPRRLYGNHHATRPVQMRGAALRQMRQSVRHAGQSPLLVSRLRDHGFSGVTI